MHSMRYSIAALLVAVTAPAQDTVHVRAGAPAWGTNVGVQQLYVLGAAPDYRIRVFYGMAVDKMNRVYIHDLNPEASNPRVDAYDANGHFVKTFGRKGSGPGEYKTIFGMAVVQDSILAAWDFSTSRITLWQPDGSVVRTISLDKAYTGTSWFALSADTANLLYLQTHTYLYGPDGRLTPNQPPDGNPIFVRFRPDGTIADSIAAPKLDALTTRRTTYSLFGGYVTWDNFVPEVSLKPSAVGGLVYGRGDTYRFTIQPANPPSVVGDARRAPGAATARRPVRIVEKDWTPIPLAPEERSEWEAFVGTKTNRDGTTGGFQIPKVKPAYRDLFVDADGRIWLDLYAPAAKRELPERDPKITTPRIHWLPQQTYDVFDPTGRYLGKVVLPWNQGTLVQARGDRLWMRGVGPDDEALVVAFKLTGIKGH